MDTIALRYRRVSGREQEENSSLDKQLERMDLYCQEHGYITRDEWLWTEAMTAKDTWRDRPELQKLLACAEHLGNDTSHEVCVVCDHDDRWARGNNFVILVDMLRHFHTRLEFCQTSFEDSPEGELLMFVHSWASGREWGRIVKRTHDGLVDRVVKDHKPLGSMALYGYKWDDPAPKAKNCYIYNDDIIHTDGNGTQWSERMVVAYMYEMVKKGMTLHRIAQTLNELGVPTRQRFGTSKWQIARISEILSNPKYKGVYYSFQHTFTRSGKNYLRTPKPLDERVLLPDACPAIVSEELWDIVQAQLTYNKKNSVRNTRFPENALCRGKIARCAYCGSSMAFITDSERSRYRCPKAKAKNGCAEQNTITCSLVDTAVWKRCCEIIRDPSLMRRAIEALQTPDPTEKQRLPVASRKKKLEEDISEYVDLLHTAKTDITRKNARAWIAQLEEQLEEIEREEKILLAIQHNWQKTEDEIKKFEQWCISLRPELDNVTYSQRRTIVELLGVRVYIWKYGTTPRLKIDFAPPKILDALADMGKKGTLTSDTLNFPNSKPTIFLSFEEFLDVA